MRQTLKLFILKNVDADECDVFIAFSHTMDLAQARQLARKAADIRDDAECEEYQLPEDYDNGRLRGVGLRAYLDLIS